MFSIRILKHAKKTSGGAKSSYRLKTQPHYPEEGNTGLPNQGARHYGDRNQTNYSVFMLTEYEFERRILNN